VAAAAVPQERQGSRGVHQALGARELLLGEVSFHGGAWMMEICGTGGAGGTGWG